ncbi:MAG: ATP-binding protein [Muribaculaceae bacterium]|nr:ATP-binding protein [Muribaculaceae bacterium]
MIVSLKFKNYRSYREEAEFSLLAQPTDFNSGATSTIKLHDGSSLCLLNSAAIFGANASGKSSVIYALSALSDMVRESLSYNQTHGIPLRIPYGLDPNTYNLSTDISVNFIVADKRYEYSLSIGNSGIVNEELSLYNDSKFDLVFKRSLTDNSGLGLVLGPGWLSATLELSDLMLLNNQLLLSWMATKEANGLQDVADYLANLMIQTPDNMLFGGAQLSKIAEEFFDGCKSPLYGQFTKLMQIADLGISDAVFRRHDDSDFSFPSSVPLETQKAFIQKNRWEINLIHKMDNNKDQCELPLSLESEGTKALFRIAPYILYALENGKFLAYDEISTAIHPSLFRFIVNLFHNPKSNPKGAQLVFTTHDASVADYNTLRADQIWFAEKTNGSSELFSAQDFDDISINVPFEKWYRSGRFGALPKFGSIDFIFE